MDIIYVCSAPTKREALMRKVCDLSHTRRFGEGRRIWLKDADTPKGFLAAMEKVVSDDSLHDTCILSRDTSIINADFDVSQPHCSARSLWLKRKGIERDAMVSTLAWLLENGCGTKDYELGAPQAFGRKEMRDTIEKAKGGGLKLLRTMHFNRFSDAPVLMEDPTLDKWVWNQVPDTPVITLSETCFAHEDCIRYLLNYE